MVFPFWEEISGLKQLTPDGKPQGMSSTVNPRLSPFFALTLLRDHASA
jgi:hypothetical protein